MRIKILITTVVGVGIMNVVEFLEEVVFSVPDYLWSYIQMPFLVVFGFIVYGFRKKVLDSVLIGALIFGLYSLTNHLISRDFSTLFIGTLFSAIIGIVPSLVGGLIRKTTLRLFKF